VSESVTVGKAKACTCALESVSRASRAEAGKKQPHKDDPGCAEHGAKEGNVLARHAHGLRRSHLVAEIDRAESFLVIGRTSVAAASRRRRPGHGVRLIVGIAGGGRGGRQSRHNSHRQTADGRRCRPAARGRRSRRIVRG
jgi:hypothetical protein